MKMSAKNDSRLNSSSFVGAATSTASSSLPENSNSKRSRPSKPNHRHNHQFPLPLTVHPLPPLIPHNPVSVISVLLSYLTCLISPPKHELYSAYFDAATSSVHVTDEKTVQALWEMGFFGKGSLSRSTPSWMAREKKRRGEMLGITSEENTGKRRVERREFKLERARKEREAIAQRLKEESLLKNGSATESAIEEPLVESSTTSKSSPTATQLNLNSASHSTTSIEEPKVENGYAKGSQAPTANGSAAKTGLENSKTVRFSPEVTERQFDSYQNIVTSHSEANSYIEEAILNEEHLQLSLEETYFLVYGLGVLQVYDDTRTKIIPTESLFGLFRQHSYFPCLHSTKELQPDDPFVLSYAVYHHFRSLGWVVRSGVKFGVDYLLYNRGPVFSHAEFAVIILPSYEHEYWSETPDGRDKVAKTKKRSWWWLHCVNRVQAQVKKTLVLCFVNVPPPATQHSAGDPENEDIGATLREYRVRELIIRRWIPNRSRD